MADRKAAPSSREVLENQATVTVVGLRFTAEQDGRFLERSVADAILNLSLVHEIQKRLLIGLPAALLFLVLIEHLLRWREERLVLVRRATNLVQEEAQVVFFCKASELRNVVETNIEETA